MQEARSWLIFMNAACIIFQTVSMIKAKSERQLYINIAYQIGSLLNIAIIVRMNSILMHIAFSYMMIRLPIRLLDFEQSQNTKVETEWVHHLVFVSIGAVMNILEYSRFIPRKPFPLLLIFIGLIYLSAAAKVGLAGEFDLNKFVGMNLGTSFIGMSYIIYSKYSQKNYID